MNISFRILEARPVRWILALGWTACTMVLLLQPTEAQVINTGIAPGPPSLAREIVFTIGHLFVFAVLTALWRWALGAHLPPARAMWTAVAVALLVGILTEWGQTLVPSRGVQLTDLMADAAAALLVAWVWPKM